MDTDSIETGLRKTRLRSSSPARNYALPKNETLSSGEKTPRAGSISNLSKTSSGSRTPRDSNSSPEGSPLNRAGYSLAARNCGSLRKPPAMTGSVGKASSPIPKSCKSPISGSNTWNGRQAKKRPSIQSDTFMSPQATSTACAATSSFSRKSPARQSLPRPSSNGGLQYDRNGRRIRGSATGSLQSSPTKVANPLLEQILQKVGHLQDDREMVRKLQDLLKTYQTGSNDGAVNMALTKAWVDSNGTATLPQDSPVTTNPRKDPKPVSERGGYSRIPAPVSYKRPMSVASDSV